MHRVFSFRTRLLNVAAVFFLCLILVMSVVVPHSFSNAIWRQQEQNTISSLALTAREIAALLNDAKNTVTAMTLNPVVTGYVWGAYATDVEWVSARVELLQTLKTIISEHRALAGVLFVKPDNTITGHLFSRLFALQQVPQTPLIRELLEEDAQSEFIHWSGPYKLSDFGVPVSNMEKKMEQVILGAIHRYQTLAGDKEPRRFTLVAAVNTDLLMESFAYLQGENEGIYLLDEKGITITGIPENETVSLLSNEELTEQQGRSRRIIQGEERYMFFYRIPVTGWYLVKTAPTSAYDRELQQLKHTLYISAGVLFGVSVVLFSLWTRGFTSSLMQITRAMAYVRDGNLNKRIEGPMKIPECELIREQFNHMGDSIQLLVAETQRAEREKVRMELQSLHSQLSPHMIFNSISAIRWVSMIMGVDQVSDMLAALAELLRPMFREWTPYWTLRDELNYMEHYLKLLRLRYGSTICTTCSVEPGLDDFFLPRFTLQPVLENCFEHGNQNQTVMRVDLNIIHGNDDEMIAVVQDNGQGMTSEALNALRQRLAGQTSMEKGGIGLINVQRKIQIMCGKAYGLQVESELGKGTRVSIRIGKTLHDLDYFSIKQ